MEIISNVKDYVLRENDKLIKRDNYDMWDNHIKYVVDESLYLAKFYNADCEIVELSALLHDIALIKYGISVKKEHHILWAEIARKILTKFNYENDKMERVCKCILHHRTSKKAENIEELCVADADILAHFSNIPMILKNIVSNDLQASVDKINNEIKDYLNKDYADLSPQTQKEFKKCFETICAVLLKK